MTIGTVMTITAKDSITEPRSRKTTSSTAMMPDRRPAESPGHAVGRDLGQRVTPTKNEKICAPKISP